MLTLLWTTYSPSILNTNAGNARLSVLLSRTVFTFLFSWLLVLRGGRRGMWSLSENEMKTMQGTCGGAEDRIGIALVVYVSNFKFQSSLIVLYVNLNDTNDCPTSTRQADVVVVSESAPQPQDDDVQMLQQDIPDPAPKQMNSVLKNLYNRNSDERPPPFDSPASGSSVPPTPITLSASSSSSMQAPIPTHPHITSGQKPRASAPFPMAYGQMPPPRGPHPGFDQTGPPGSKRPRRGAFRDDSVLLGPEPVRSERAFADFGGIEDHHEQLSRILLHLRHPEIYEALGLSDSPRGLLLHGPPGCGKSLLAECIAGELDLPMLKVAATEVVSGISGDSEAQLRSIFARARQEAPCLLVIDEIDSIGAKRENAAREMEKRIVSQLISCLDDLSSGINSNELGARVLVVATTSRPETIDPSLRRAGRFDKELAIGMPSAASRYKILSILCAKVKLSHDVSLNQIAHLTPGFVGADLKSLVREAGLCAVNEVLSQVSHQPFGLGKVAHLHELLSSSEAVPAKVLSNIFITSEHFTIACKHVQPSAKREGFATVPDVTWSDVGALDDVKRELALVIMAPVRFPDQFASLGLQSTPGILLVGPPGCGKTLVAKAIANEAGLNFISVKGPELLNMYVGESERAVRQVFARAQASSPCVIFFDEIDSLCPRRVGGSEVSSRLVNQMLTELDGVQARTEVFVVAATNRPDILDAALLRPGRLDKQLFVGLPNPAERLDILAKITKDGCRPKLYPNVYFASAFVLLTSYD